MEAPAKIIESGRVTIPEPIRTRYGLEKGDYVIINVRPVEGDEDE